VAPTPEEPFEYVTVRAVVDAATTDALTSRPFDIESTYALVAASCA